MKISASVKQSSPCAGTARGRQGLSLPRKSFQIVIMNNIEKYWRRQQAGSNVHPLKSKDSNLKKAASGPDLACITYRPEPDWAILRTWMFKGKEKSRNWRVDKTRWRTLQNHAAKMLESWKARRREENWKRRLALPSFAGTIDGSGEPFAPGSEGKAIHLWK